VEESGVQMGDHSKQRDPQSRRPHAVTNRTTIEVDYIKKSHSKYYPIAGCSIMQE